MKKGWRWTPSDRFLKRSRDGTLDCRQWRPKRPLSIVNQSNSTTRMRKKNDTSIETENQSQNRHEWILYALLVICRIFVCPFLPGYVHPDEFFQGGQELWFGCPPFTPWEFESQNALRSILPPTLMTWLPLRIYAFVTQRSSIYNLSGREILVIPRIFSGMLSVLTVDLSLWCMSTATGNQETSPPPAVLVIASAWPSLVLLNRPFTNSLETMLLALLLFVSICMRREYLTDFLSGILCSLGLFTRFTFVFVALPTILMYLRDKVTASPPFKAFRGIITMAIGFILTSACIVYADVLNYSHNESDSISWTSFVTPLNALLYNSQVENLKHHGLHPRWTHAVVNMLLLYGPLAITFYIMLAKKVFSLKGRAESKIQTVCLWTVVSDLGFLSMAPHQEPRFLLPLLVPLAILSQLYTGTSAWMRRVWVAFNMILLVFYGVLHQGGVIPSLIASSSITARGDSATRAILYYHTYMPPTFASRTRSDKHVNADHSCAATTGGDGGQGSKYCLTKSFSCGNVPIIDLKGSPIEDLLSALNEHLACGDRDADNTEIDSGRVYLVSPPLKMGTVVIGANGCSLGESYICNQITSFRPHLTTEDFPSFDGSILNFLSNLELSYYDISCQ